MFMKILCIFATTIALHISSTSLNTPASNSEKQISTSVIELILTCQHVRKAQKLAYWLVAMAEIAAIVAQHGPAWTYSGTIMNVLSFDVDLNSVAMTHSLATGSLLVVIGGILRLQCYTALGRHFTFAAVIRRDHQLVKDGPYNYMRHPSYTGAVLAYIGFMIYYGSSGTWFRECLISGTTVGQILAGSGAIGMSLVICGLLFRIPKEDRPLRKKFGKEWETWAAQPQYTTAG
ncbi:hypothetical protein MVEN_00064300 [Mycena venus]|uniref:Protein-S-isoprenylcysteine O-methyltransferase n=1 Tax=Mycena venus TaxID=2733690 RepID=A0A8H6Z3S2_9AGAR|nr:hypothetical protein MVEN_00064300 [Mycena venus]